MSISSRGSAIQPRWSIGVSDGMACSSTTSSIRARWPWSWRMLTMSGKTEPTWMPPGTGRPASIPNALRSSVSPAR